VAYGTVNVTVAASVTLSTPQNTPVTVPPSYFDSYGNPLAVASITQPLPGLGSVTLNSSGQVVYAPPSGFTGTVTFSYVVDDGHGGTILINVTVTVTA
jgi:hypothetical protein